MFNNQKRSFEAIYQGKGIQLPNFHFTIEKNIVDNIPVYVGHCLDFSITEYTTETDYKKAEKKIFKKLCISVSNYLFYLIERNKIDYMYENSVKIDRSNIWGEYQDLSQKAKIEILKESIGDIEYEPELQAESTDIDFKDILINNYKNENQKLIQENKKLKELLNDSPNNYFLSEAC